MILIIDNFDSFTYNVFQFLSELTDEEIKVYRNNVLSIADIEALKPSRIVLSPGPGRPEDAGICEEVLRNFSGRIPILGICLGHQAIAQVYGADIVEAPRILHGKTESVLHDGKGLFRALPQSLLCTRYHSLIVDPPSLPEELEVSAWTEQGEIMGLRHKELLIEGLQFHPESIASEEGKGMLRRFLDYRRKGFMLAPLLTALMSREGEEVEELRVFTEELTEGNVSPLQIASVVSALGVCPSADVLAAMASALRAKATPFPRSGEALDTCGTGGDGRGTHNISSLAALLAAACGVPVAKHGNKAVSSRSGSADLYRELGIAFQLSPSAAGELLEKTQFTFLFAPLYHGGMRHAAAVRRELGVKTVFNLLGPLANPAAATSQLLGVFDKALLRPMAEAARKLGVRRVMTVYGDGLDELSVSAVSDAFYLDDTGRREEMKVDPRDYGMTLYPDEALEGGTPEENAEVARNFIYGSGPEALRDAVFLNAAAALFVAGASTDIAEALRSVRGAYEEGALQRSFEAIRAESQALASSHE